MKTSSTLRAVPVLLATLLALHAGSTSAQANIDEKKALAGAVTPGDEPGYPLTLSQPGHYRLMGNLNVPAGSTGIVITGRHVTLDLNGFSVNGGGSCTQDPTTRVVSCTQAANANARGIHVQAPGAVIRNGVVRGFGGVGILGWGNDTIENVQAVENRNMGIAIAWNENKRGARLSGVTAQLNMNAGIFMYSGVVERSRADANYMGISGGNGTLVVDSSTTGNQLTGMQIVVARSTVSTLNGTNRAQVISLGGNLDGSTVY